MFIDKNNTSRYLCAFEFFNWMFYTMWGIISMILLLISTTADRSNSMMIYNYSYYP